MDTHKDRPALIWCSVSDSNRPPTHYKCVALPNELTEQVFGLAPPTRTEILYAPNVVTYQLAQCEIIYFNYLTNLTIGQCIFVQ